mmetsp:Transcript_11104/g.30692  ORF Transcript_11104/g.30692 Transcript_11104/m.30692 type:complete len:87 (-) Transcript_11104:53-313(-)
MENEENVSGETKGCGKGVGKVSKRGQPVSQFQGCGKDKIEQQAIENQWEQYQQRDTGHKTYFAAADDDSNHCEPAKGPSRCKTHEH